MVGHGAEKWDRRQPQACPRGPREGCCSTCGSDGLHPAVLLYRLVTINDQHVLLVADLSENRDQRALSGGDTSVDEVFRMLAANIVMTTRDRPQTRCLAFRTISGAHRQ